MIHQAITPGTRITAAYRDYHHQGTVLAVDDPDAWRNTLAFPTDTPDPADVTTHVRRCQDRERHLIATGRVTRRDSLPVRWDFGRVYWEHADNLEPVTLALTA